MKNSPKNSSKTNFNDSNKGLSSPATRQYFIDVTITLNRADWPSTGSGFDAPPRYYEVLSAGVVTLTDGSGNVVPWNVGAGKMIRFSDAETVVTDGTAQIIALW